MNIIDSLANRIHILKAAYAEGTPLMSDEAYNFLEEKLRKLSPQHPELSKVTGELVSKFPKATEGVPMLSLKKSYKQDEIVDFISNKAVTISEKLDGMSLELRYRDGELVEAVSRGRGGELGFVVTSSAMFLLDLPLTVRGFFGEIRGEVIQTFEDFKVYSKQCEANGDELPTHPRNVVVGTMRQEDPRTVRERKLRFRAYKIVGQEDDYPTERSVFSFLIANGFTVPSAEVYTKTENFRLQQQDIFDQWKRRLASAPYSCDGIVITYNDRDLQKSLGNATDHPRGAMAFKWENEKAETIVMDIEWTTGRTGKVHPTGVVTPTDLSGATISNVTFHNLGYVKKHDIKIGAKILIIRSGEIIPKHLETIEDGTHWLIPDVCPSCGSRLEISSHKNGKEVIENLTCVSTSCPAQLFEIVLHYARIVEMDHVDEGVLMGLWEKQIVKSIPDLYRLDLKTLESLTINGKNLGSSRAKKIMSSVEKISKLPLGIFVGALGIPKVGKNTATGMAKHFGSLDAILTAQPNEFYGLKAFADTKVDIVYTGIQNRLPLIKELMQYVTIVTDSSAVVVNNTLKGATFVITGTLSNPRDEVEKLLVAAGGVLQSAVSKSTNYVVVGDSPGASKMEKAQKLKTRTINENELMEFIARGLK